jgi:hypothetical protein
VSTTIAEILEIPESTYHADELGDERPSLSKSIAHILLTKSAAHARAAHPKFTPQPAVEQSKYDVGNAAHALLLEGTDENIVVVEEKDWKKAAAQEARATAWIEGKTPLLPKQWEKVQAMVASARVQLAGHQADPPVFTNGKPEQTIVLEENGLLLKGRFDWLGNDLDVIDDYKTTSASAAPEDWTRTMLGIGGDLQAAFYLRLRAAVAPLVERPQFRFVVQETYEPYALTVMTLAPDLMAFAETKVEHAIAAWRRCVETDVWPAYPSRVVYAQTPGYAEAQWFEREARDAA